MDILKPPIIQIGKRRYRKNPNSNWRNKDEPHSEMGDGGYNIDAVDDVVCRYDDESQLDDLDFKIHENGFKLCLSIPTTYFKFIIGKKGETKKRLENETKTRIFIPNFGDESDIVLFGHEKMMIASAKTRIEVIVNSQRHRQPFTHFLAFPLNDETIQFNFGEFKLDILRECYGDRGIDDTIFQNPLKLHLTLGTLVLLNKSEITEATQLLNACYTESIKSMVGDEAIRVRVQGLEYMNDDPNDVDVLYAKVSTLRRPQMLQVLSEKVVDRFASSGIMNQEYDNVKLHMTVMNTLLRKDPNAAPMPQSMRRRVKDRESFDAANVLKIYGDYNFGECVIPRLELCQKIGTHSSGYYTTVASVPLS